MTAPEIVVGVDPGRTVGVAVLGRTGPPTLLQTTPHGARDVVALYLSDGRPAVLALEQYVVGPRSARTADRGAGRATRDLIGALTDLGRSHGAAVRTHPAAVIKPWATDARLDAAGATAPGMRHARDAARAALFVACSECGFPDPLSTATTRSPR